MLSYTLKADKIIKTPFGDMACFDNKEGDNIDEITVSSFGDEWAEFHEFDKSDLKTAGDQYFDIVDETILSAAENVLDIGCGSGRWAYYLADRVQVIEAVDPSSAVYAAMSVCQNLDNVRISQAGVDNIPFEDDSFDFAYSLGVLHHIPDTAKALKSAVKKLKPKGHFLLYLYYSFDNRPAWFKLMHSASELLRSIISKLPTSIKKIVTDLLAVLLYMPFVFTARICKGILKNDFYKSIPLSYYTDKSFYIIRNDSLDRFGTPLEQRFSKVEITAMMEAAGLENIKFSENEPYWHAIGQKEA